MGRARRRSQAFRGSSHARGDDRVEVAEAPEGLIVVRHSRDADLGTLSFTRTEWEAFVRGVKDGEFDVPVPPTTT